jgi:glycosyltransferase involved in cell wall biosynthesis
VDSESTDNTELITEKFVAQIITETEHNIAKVRNTGAKSAKGDILVFVDTDTRVPETLLQKVTDVMQDEKCFGVRFLSIMAN